MVFINLRNVVSVFTLVGIALLSLGNAQKGQGADGNPHGWDRRRRCDHAGYTPKCGVCEGYGGIPYGDNNDQITLTTCEPVATASDIDPATLKRPIWARTFSTHSWEVLIGKKTDPFCFQTFPGNSSEGALCYRPQTGVQSYEFEKARAIREDLTLKTPVGNITTTVLHQGRNFWVVNKLPNPLPVVLWSRGTVSSGWATTGDGEKKVPKK